MSKCCKEYEPDDRGIRWYEFDGPEAKGRIGIEVGSYGLEVYLNDYETHIGLIDLFHQSKLGMNDLYPSHAQIVIDGSPDVVAFAKFLPEGTRIFLENDVRPLAKYPVYGQSYGIPED